MEKFLFACIIICHLLFELKITCSSPRPTSTCLLYCSRTYDYELMIKNKKQVILRERKTCQLIQVDLFAHTLFLLYIAFQLSRKKFYGMLIVLF